MSPVFILSRLCLKRRFQFFGISVETPVSEDDSDFLLADHAPQTDLLGILGRDLHRHVVVQDLDRQVLALLAEDLALLLLDDRPRPVVGIDHLVADVVQARPPLAESRSSVKKAGTPLCAGHRVRV
jgi:CBS domain-containing protein